MTPYTWRQRYKIHRRALKKVGLVQKQDEDEFMDECVQEVLADGEASDVDEAIEMCEMMWDDMDGENGSES